jgi:hypothetical protein
MSRYTGGGAMPGAEADGPVEVTKGGAGQLIIPLGSAAMFGAVADCLPARLGRHRDQRINARCHRSSVSRRSSRNRDGQGGSRTQQDGRNLIVRSGSPSSDPARVPECNSTG